MTPCILDYIINSQFYKKRTKTIREKIIILDNFQFSWSKLLRTRLKWVVDTKCNFFYNKKSSVI